MMPPNAQNISTTAAAEITTPSATNTAYLPAFSDDAVDHSQAEVAKTFHYREFGNGAANGGGGGSAPYADASMLNTTDNIAYVMDDGLTSLSVEGWVGHATYGLQSGGANESAYLTFIGTGISWKQRSVTHGGNDEFRWFVDGVEVKVYDGSGTTSEYENIAQNLPYGTHIVEIRCVGLANNADQSFHEFTFHQPKIPPIPEDAVVLADYMLMADYVANTSNGNHLISKGVRAVSHTKDIFYEEVNTFVKSFYDTGAFPGMGYLASSSSSTNATNNKYSLPAFGTTFQVNGHTSQTNNDLFIDGGDVAQSGTTSGNHGDISYPDAAVTLGLHKFAVHGASGQSYSPYLSGLGFKIATPIHTSSHYQPFETPWLYELVGGDRNMEQTNLVVTAEGKTWDEITRDVSYIGNIVHQPGSNAGYNEDVIVIMDDRRGRRSARLGPCIQKDFACAYDRDICLRSGEYAIHTTSVGTGGSTAGGVCRIYINGVHRKQGSTGAGGYAQSTIFTVAQLKRGDYVQVKGQWHANHALNSYWIDRV